MNFKVNTGSETESTIRTLISTKKVKPDFTSLDAARVNTVALAWKLEYSTSRDILPLQWLGSLLHDEECESAVANDKSIAALTGIYR